MLNPKSLRLAKCCARLIFLFWFTFLATICTAQENEKDEKKKEVQKILQAELDTLLKIESKDPVLAVKRSLQAKQLAKANDMSTAELTFNNRLGTSLLRTMDTTMLKEFLEDGERLIRTSDKLKGIANFYHLKCRYYSMVGPKDSVEINLQKELVIREETRDTTGIIGAYFRFSSVFCTDLECSLKYLRRAYRFAEMKSDSFRMAVAMGNMGNEMLMQSEDLDSSMYYFQTSNEIFKRLEYDVAVAQGYFNMGKVYKFRGDYKSAIESQIKHLELRRKLGDKRGEITAFNQISDLYYLMDRPDDGKENLLKAKNIALAIGDKSMQVHIFNALGENLIDSDQDSALYYFQKTIELSEDIGELQTLSAAHVNIGKIHAGSNNHELAENFMLKGLELLSESNSNGDMPGALLSLSDMYLDWFEKSEENGAQGPSLLNVEDILNEIESKISTNSQFEIEETLYKNFIRLNEAKEASIPLIKYQAKLIALRDSFIENSNMELANEYAEKLKTSEKEKQILALESENKIASFRSKMFASMLVGAIVFFGILFLIYQRLTKERNERNQLVENQRFRTRISRNLHDDVSSLLNSLAMQSELAAAAGDGSNSSVYKDIAVKSRQAVQNLRDTVWAIDSSKDKYENLLDRILDYGDDHLSIKNFEFKIEKINWQSEVEINPAFRQNIYLVFKESITNILKHSTGNMVKLIIGFQDKNFLMKIHDNGTINTGKKSGVGINSMTKRIQELGGEIIFDTSNGYTTQVQVPL